MDQRSSLSSSTSHARLVSKDIAPLRVRKRGGNLRIYARSNLPPNNVASTGEFETDDGDDEGVDCEHSESRLPRGEESSRKKLEVMSGFLKEGYGIGAVLTAAAIRGAAITTDALKGMTKSGTAAARARRVKHQPRKKQQTPKHDAPSIVERLQQSVSANLMATPIKWKKLPDDQIPLSPENQLENDLSQPLVQNQEDAKYAQDQGLRCEEIPHDPEQKEGLDLGGYKRLLGIPENEPITSSHITEDRLGPAAFLGACNDRIYRPGLQEDPTKKEETEIRHDPFATEKALGSGDVLEDLNVAETRIEGEEVHMQDTSLQENASLGDVEEAICESPVADVVVKSEAESLKKDSSIYGSTSLSEEQIKEDDEIPPDKEDHSTIVFSRAKKILDEIANFEIETGASFDNPEKEEIQMEDDCMQPSPSIDALGETPAPENEARNEDQLQAESVQEESTEKGKPSLEEPMEVVTTAGDSEVDGDQLTEEELPQKSKAEIEEELKREMRIESEKRLRAMKLQNEERFLRKPTVEVGLPSPTHKSSPTRAKVTDENKGLDYIKSYAKETQENLIKHSDDNDEEAALDRSSSVFTPPSIQQDTKSDPYVAHATSGSPRSYSQWRDVDRLKRVREIGTVLWLGRGENGGSGDGRGGGNGGFGGGGDNSEDKNWWWIQVGVSMVTMTALVFALLTALSSQLEKQTRFKANNPEQSPQ